MTGFQRFAATLGLVACGIVQAATQNLIWQEAEVARASIGYKSAHKQFTFRTFNLLVYGPEELADPPQVDMRIVDTCIRQSFAKTRTRLEDLLGSVAQPTGSLSPDELKTARHRRDTSAETSVNTAISYYNDLLGTCAQKRFDYKLYNLGLVQRACDESTKNSEQRIGPRGQRRPAITYPCKGAAGAFSDDPATVRFSVLSYWQDARSSNHLPLPADYIVALPPSALATAFKTSGATPSISEAMKNCAKQARNDRSQGCKALEVITQAPLDPGTTPTPDAAHYRSQFEDLVAEARSRGRRIDRNIPRIAGVSKGAAYRVVDVLDEPQDAVLDLTGGANDKLISIQDELARARITECYRFRGVEIADLANCSGYRVSQSTLEACLAGGKCMPDIAKNGGAMVLAQMVTGARERIAVTNLVPRTRTNLTTLEADVRGCLGTAQMPKTEKEAQACILMKQLPPMAQETANCILAGKSIFDCPALEKHATSQAMAATKCLQVGNTGEEKSLCALRVGLPPDVGVLMECYQKVTKSEELLLCAPKELQDAKDAARCRNDHPTSKWAAATCFAHGRVPDQAGYLLECASEGTSTAGLVGCMAGKNLPEDFRKPLQCVAESGGEPIGVGLCMIGDGLTPEQRIALQCVVSTAGVPAPLAACVVGQLVIKELFNCVNNKLFEGNCMGKNNEIVKLFAALHINLNASTVVGQILNAQLDFVKFNIAAAQAIIGGAQKLADNIEREVIRAEKAATAAINAAIAVQVAAIHLAQEIAAAAAAALNAAAALIQGIGKAFGIRW